MMTVRHEREHPNPGPERQYQFFPQLFPSSGPVMVTQPALGPRTNNRAVALADAFPTSARRCSSSCVGIVLSDRDKRVDGASIVIGMIDYVYDR